VDGGLVSNNPSLELLTEVAEYNCAQRAVGHEEMIVKPRVLLSLGTGIPPIKKVEISLFPLICLNAKILLFTFRRQ